jgi:hypothetical protein
MADKGGEDLARHWASTVVVDTVVVKVLITVVGAVMGTGGCSSSSFSFSIEQVVTDLPALYAD